VRLRGGVVYPGFGIALAVECFYPRPVVGSVYGPAVRARPHDVAASFSRVTHRITVLIVCSMTTPSTADQWKTGVDGAARPPRVIHRRLISPLARKIIALRGAR